jgi:hypothetical protein
VSLKKSRTNVNTSSISIKCTIDTIDNISTNHTRLIVGRCPQRCFLHCHGGNCHHYHCQQRRDISCIVDANATTNNATGGVAMNPTINGNDRRSKYNNRRIPLKKNTHTVSFSLQQQLSGTCLISSCCCLFCGGGVSLHSQKDTKIWCHHGSCSKTSKDPEIQT